MNPRMCMVLQDPPKSYSDCVRACIATIIDRDDVPHVFDARSFDAQGNLDPDAIIIAWKEIRAYLAQHKKTLAIFPVGDEHAAFMMLNNPGTPYILWHMSGSGPHACICKDGAKIHDPAYYRTGIEGPLPQFGVYIIGIIGDLI